MIGDASFIENDRMILLVRAVFSELPAASVANRLKPGFFFKNRDSVIFGFLGNPAQKDP